MDEQTSGQGGEARPGGTRGEAGSGGGSVEAQPGGASGTRGDAREAAAESPVLVHVLPLKLLAGVFGSLVVLTIATVAATHVNLGSGNLWLALTIATCKATLVALFFMHLRWDRPINGVIFLWALLFVLLFVGMALTDSSSYRPDLIPGYAPAMPK